MNLEDKIKKLSDMIRISQNIVFLGGAGVSTESGLKDFRSGDGIYNTLKKYHSRPEEILSHNFFYRKTDVFYKYYKENLLDLNVKPNSAHLFLTKLEKIGKLKAIITQNIDGLHQMAESVNVLELHGSIHRNYCDTCNSFFELEYIINSNGIAKCNICHNFIKPDVVLYGESLNMDTMSKAINYIKNADLLIVGGTSLVVYPAAGLLEYYEGNKLVLINKEATPYDEKADLVINSSIGRVFEAITI